MKKSTKEQPEKAESSFLFVDPNCTAAMNSLCGEALPETSFAKFMRLVGFPLHTKYGPPKPGVVTSRPSRVPFSIADESAEQQ